jgi:hypothetical protein
VDPLVRSAEEFPIEGPDPRCDVQCHLRHLLDCSWAVRGSVGQGPTSSRRTSPSVSALQESVSTVNSSPSRRVSSSQSRLSGSGHPSRAAAPNSVPSESRHYPCRRGRGWRSGGSPRAALRPLPGYAHADPRRQPTENEGWCLPRRCEPGCVPPGVRRRAGVPPAQV